MNILDLNIKKFKILDNGDELFLKSNSIGRKLLFHLSFLCEVV